MSIRTRLAEWLLGYDAGEPNRMRSDLGWGRRVPKDEDSLFLDRTRELIRQKGFDLQRNNGPVQGMCNRLALFTVGPTGILPQAVSDWHRLAHDWFLDWAERCDYRKRTNLYGLQYQAVSTRPTHGGYYLELLDNGQVRPIECERIRMPKDQKMQAGYVDGIKIKPETGERVSYRVHARDQFGGFSTEHGERDVPAEKMLPVIRPPWRPDQVREIPDFACVIPALQDISEMNTYTLNTAKTQSKVIGFIKRLNGLANIGQRGLVNTNAGERQTFRHEWGELLEGFPNEDYEMMASPTPGSNHIPYVKFQYGLCSAALGFPYEFFTLDLAGLDYSRQKGMLLLVNHAIRPWRSWVISSLLQPLWNWRIPLAIADGELPAAPAENGISTWNHIQWQAPEELWIDRQESMQADSLEISAGLNTFSGAARRRGGTFEQNLRAKARDLKLIQQIATEEGVDPDELSKLVIPGQAQSQPTKEAEPKKENDNAGSEQKNVGQ